MYFLSKNFKKNWFNYIWQSLSAGIIATIFIYFFSKRGFLLLAGIGSTFFTIFAVPNNRTAQTRNIIGSYIISIISGIIGFSYFPPLFSGGFTIGLATFLMVITDTEHPPAAGIALGLTMIESNIILYEGAFLSMMAAILSVLLRYLLKPWMKDLF